MPNEIPGTPHKDQISHQPLAPLTPQAVTAIEQAQAGQKKTLAASEKPDHRRAALATLVMDHWQDNADQFTCFGVPVQPDMVPEKIVDYLVAIETDTGLDLAEDGLEAEDIGALLRDKLTTSAATVELQTIQGHQNAEETKLDQKAQTKANYQAATDQLKADGKSNVEMVLALANNPDVPVTERAKLQAFRTIINIAQTTPADAKIITERLNRQNFSDGIPEPESFVYWAIFDSPNVPSGVSEATQEAIATKLGIVRHKYTVKTGGDVKDVFDTGFGTETYLDANGHPQTRKVPLAPGQDVKIRDNQYLSVDQAGNKKLKIATKVGDFQVNLPDNPTAEDMTQIVASTQMIAAMHELDLAEVIYERPITDRGSGEIELRFPGDFNRTKRLAHILLGGASGYDGEILDQREIDKIPSLLQFPKTNSETESVRGGLEELGVIENGMMNWVRLEEVLVCESN